MEERKNISENLMEEKENGGLNQEVTAQTASLSTKNKKSIKIGIIAAIAVIPVICILIAVASYMHTEVIPNNKYRTAIALMDEGEYSKAISVFASLNSYKDSANMIKECKYQIVLELIEAEEYSYALSVIDELGAYQYREKVKECKYQLAVIMFNEGEYSKVLDILAYDVGDYENSADMVKECKYQLAVAQMNTGDYHNALDMFIYDIGDYKDSANNIKECKYQLALLQVNEGEYSKAMSVFEEMIDYKESADMVKECKYQLAFIQLNDGNIAEAYENWASLRGYKDSAEKAEAIYENYKNEKFKNIRSGDYIFFGKYEQDNNTSNGKENIEWLVLEVKDGKALVISKYIIENRKYHPTYTSVTWETCDLRKWLNDSFLNSAFTASEKAMIPTVTVSADKNMACPLPDPGNATKDKVFLLSITEATKYFSSASERKGEFTPYSFANKVSESGYLENYWWLRGPGVSQAFAAGIDSGYVQEVGVAIHRIYGVRPALWINIGN